MSSASDRAKFKIKKGKIINCKNCGKKIYVPLWKIKRGEGRFCNKKCYGEHKGKNMLGDKHPNWKGGKIKRICLVCNKEFNVTLSNIKKGYGKFCSRKCHGVYMSKYKTGQNHPLWNRVKRVCQNCGEGFNVTLSNIKKGYGKFCNKKCYGEYKSKYNKGAKNPNWKGGKIKRICLRCNKEFKIKPILAKKGFGNFCGTKCYHKYYSGKNSYLWLGGISFEPYPIEWKQSLKKQIRERDNYTCQLCNKPNSKCVHHIDYIKKNCSISNLIVLCKKCHNKTNFNRSYWKKKFMKIERIGETNE